MPRSRFLWPGFFTDGKLAKVSKNARLLFAGVWCYDDDAGNHPCDPEDLKNEVFPFDKDVDKWGVGLLVIELVQADYRLIPYVSDDRVYLHTRNFLKFQPTKYPSAPQHPLPPFETKVVEEPKKGKGKRRLQGYEVKKKDLDDYLKTQAPSAFGALWGTCSPQPFLPGVGDVSPSSSSCSSRNLKSEHRNSSSSTVQEAPTPLSQPETHVERRRSRLPCLTKPAMLAQITQHIEAPLGRSLTTGPGSESESIPEALSARYCLNESWCRLGDSPAMCADVVSVAAKRYKSRLVNLRAARSPVSDPVGLFCSLLSEVRVALSTSFVELAEAAEKAENDKEATTP